ncbi:MAG: hypothetical protein IT462_01445 [Planctomycetes bacterium]|nr:hypothetical protein [Planctomycetota bacterium]
MARSLEQTMAEMLELQRASLRLQKFAISLQSECVVYLNAIATGADKKPAAIEDRVWKTIQRMRKTLEKVERGQALPK